MYKWKKKCESKWNIWYGKKEVVGVIQGKNLDQ